MNVQTKSRLGAYGLKTKKQAAFLKELASGHSVRAAARAVGVGESTPRTWRETDPMFSERMAKALARIAARQATAEAHALARKLSKRDINSPPPSVRECTRAMRILAGSPGILASHCRHEQTRRWLLECAEHVVLGGAPASRHLPPIPRAQSRGWAPFEDWVRSITDEELMQQLAARDPRYAAALADG